MYSSRISQLAHIITLSTASVERYYLDHGLPLPSFEVGALEDTTIRDDPAAEKARITLLEATRELYDLIQGPTMQIRPDLSATDLQVIYRFDLASKVPLEGEISYDDLGSACGLSANLVRRLVRYAIVQHRIFQEKRDGFVSHSAASRLLATSEDAMASIGFLYDEIYRGYAHNVDVLKRIGNPVLTDCGWTAAHQCTDTLYSSLQKDPERAARFNRSMRQLARGFGHENTSLLTGIDWASIERQSPGALVVDLGGANGHASVMIAREHPGLRFEVQDLPNVVEAVQNDVPEDVKDRVTFKAHDFKNPQPTEADVYIIRKTFHNWPDSECVKALQALRCALKPGARVIINEAVAGPPGKFPHLAQKNTTSQDMMMLTLLGTQEREERDWANLFQQADSRFINFRARLPDCCSIAVIETTWSG